MRGVAAGMRTWARRGLGLLAFATLLVVGPERGDAGRRGRAARSFPGFAPIDETTLPRLMEARGFRPSRNFKALVIRIEGQGERGLRYYPYAYGRRSAFDTSWWPASTVKLFAAIAALEKVHRLGLSSLAEVTFGYGDGAFYDDEEDQRVGLPRQMKTSVVELVDKAITESDNLAFDQLVELVGFDELNGEFLSAERGFHDTVLLRSYAHRVVDPDTRRGVHGDSPPIVLRQGSEVQRLPASRGRRQYPCPKQGNCTNLWELADALRRVMLHFELPERDRFRLGPLDLGTLTHALSARKPRGIEVVDALTAAFPDPDAVSVFHKPGFAADWFSDNVFLYREDTKQRWLVAMVNRPGRDCLNEAARIVGELLTGGDL